MLAGNIVGRVELSTAEVLAFLSVDWIHARQPGIPIVVVRKLSSIPIVVVPIASYQVPQVSVIDRLRLPRRSRVHHPTTLPARSLVSAAPVAIADLPANVRCLLSWRQPVKETGFVPLLPGAGCKSTPGFFVSRTSHKGIAMKGIDADLIHNLASCFGLAAASSFFNHLRQPKLPSLRELFATCFYTGLSAVAIACLWMHYYGMENTLFLWFTSCLAGLGSTDMLTALWSKLMPALIEVLTNMTTGLKKPKDDA